MLILRNSQEQELHDYLRSTFNTEVADSVLSCIHIVVPDSGMRQIDSVAASLMLMRCVLGVYVESAYTTAQNAPVDIQNAGYYVEQLIASLQEKYKSERIIHAAN